MKNDMEAVRLHKYLARAGVASRRACEELISSGRVSVNGEVVTQLGTKIDPEHDLVALDGERVSLPEESVVIMLNKPTGYLSAMSDMHGGRCVSELVPIERFPGLYPIGRLDKDTTGLLLFTNDGELGNALIHPRHHVPKTYLARLAGNITDKALSELRSGVMLDDGMTQSADVGVLDEDAHSSLIEITIYEGRNRQIRRMGAAIGHPVEKLERIALGPISIGDLERGSWRLLTAEEHSALLSVAGLSRDRMVRCNGRDRANSAR